MARIVDNRITAAEALSLLEQCARAHASSDNSTRTFALECACRAFRKHAETILRLEGHGGVRYLKTKRARV